MPAAFWKDYKTDLIKIKESDQGPWGGTRSIFWSSKIKYKFQIEDITRYASVNGWILVDSFQQDQNQLKRWKDNGNEIFPAVLTDIYGTENKDSIYFHNFPRWIQQDLTVYKFNTGMLQFYPGSDESTAVTGFLLLGKDGSEMTIYHLWGE